MTIFIPDRANEEQQAALTPTAPGVAGADPAPAWEQIDVGRYMPRRTRGSFPGRELG